LSRPSPDDRPVPTGDPVVQAAFEELGRLSFAEHSLESLVQRVTDLAARVIPGEPVASVTIVRGGVPATIAASTPLGRELDEVQYRHGSGPCVQAASTGRPVEVPEPASDDRWGPVAPLLAEAGCRSILSYPLPAHEAVSGGLNLYARGAEASRQRTLAILGRLAPYAVVPVSNMYLYRTAVERAGNLAAALDSRAVIDQAKGILIERFRLTPDQAFQALARVSMATNEKVREVAVRLVDTGELPEA
jgi:GAF domain-containing protein